MRGRAKWPSLAVASLALLVGGCGGEAPGAHRVSVTAPYAGNLILGQEVRLAGRTVGKVTDLTPVDRGRAARIDLAVTDDAWPLREGTKIELRWGGTVSYDNRYLALHPGKGPVLPDEDAELPASQFIAPVEFDDLLATFDGRTRRGLREMIMAGGRAFAEAEPGLRRAVERGGPAVREASYVLRDLNAEHAALHELVVSTAGTMDAVRAADPGLRELLSGAATTFAALGAEADALGQTLAQAPGTLENAEGTLARADTVLAEAGDLSRRIGPGIEEAKHLTAPLNDTLRSLEQIGPDARVTLAAAREATPRINPLIELLTDEMPRLGSIGKQAVHELNCIRPYTPETIAFFSNWGGHFAYGDGKDKYIRANVQQLLPANLNNNNVTNSGQAAKAWPGLRYGFPRPPGFNAGQLWFLEECGAGPDAIDPSKDPEARTPEDVLQIPPLLALPDEMRATGAR